MVKKNSLKAWFLASRPKTLTGAIAPVLIGGAIAWTDTVGIILQRSRQLVAIEVKSGRRTMNQGLTLFHEQFHPDTELVVGGEAMPIEQFLLMDIERLFY